jgi:colicin import membrane protein
MQVDTKNADGSVRAYASVSGERDVSGAMVNSFDPTRLLSQDFFEHAGVISNPGQPLVAGPVPISMVIFIFCIAGGLMLFASYAFFIAGLSFLGRLIELFMLIVFSPFAFMSFTIPLLSEVPDIGWKNWSQRLLASSFMAPIFMFFMYFIFLLIGAKMFDSLTTQSNPSTIVRILGIVIPALLILILLMKAAKYAKKGSGQFGEMVIKGTEIAMGATAGLAMGGAATLGQATIGRGASMVANSKWAIDREKEGKFGGALIGKTSRGLAGASFDARKGIVGAGLAVVGGVSGLNLGHKTKYFMKEAGGFEADKKRTQEKRDKLNQELKTRGSKEEKQNLADKEEIHQKALGEETIDNGIKGTGQKMTVAQRIEKVDGRIESQAKIARQAQQRASLDPTDENKARANQETDDLEKMQAEKKEITKGLEKDATGRYNTTTGNISQEGLNVAQDAEAKATAATIAATANITTATAAKVVAIQAETNAINDQAAAVARETAAKTNTTNAQNDLAADPQNLAKAALVTDAKAAEAKAIAATEAATAKITVATKAKTDAIQAETNAIQAQADATTKETNAITKANEARASAARGIGDSIADLETKIIPEARNKLDTAQKEISRSLANTIEGKSGVWSKIRYTAAQIPFLGEPGDSVATRKTDAHRIRMGAKLDSGTPTK